jgi:pimeloyl-ACP methyl ester carboxylesterase
VALMPRRQARALVPAPPYSGERVGVRGSALAGDDSKTPYPTSWGEGTRKNSSTQHLTTRARVGAVFGIVVALALTSGCRSIRAVRPAAWNGAVDRVERLQVETVDDAAVEMTLLRHGVPNTIRDDPAGTARALATRLDIQPAVATSDALSLAELSYRAGCTTQDADPEVAVGFYRDAAVLAALTLAQSDLQQPATALDLHNRAVARVIRLAQERSPHRHWQQVVADHGLNPSGGSHYLAPERIEAMSVVEDIKVTGLAHLYRAGGLGVPLVINRTNDAHAPDPQERYYPRHLRASATAVVVPGGGLQGGAWRHSPATLALVDSFHTSSVVTGSLTRPLAFDRSTPLAVQVADRNLRLLELTGLFSSQFRDGVDGGLYMLRPYEPGKIPIVLVHGLVSSPRAWAQTINELRNDPEVAARYQIWVFLYATGQPIPRSAHELREGLVRVRNDMDPQHHDPALDRMVLVGHSMGGILSKMMVQDSGRNLWDAAIRVPPDRLRASERIRDDLNGMLIFKPLPFVGRVVFIATPHRGSRLANELLGRVVSGLVRRPDNQSAALAELEELNGPDVVTRELRGRTLNSVGNLRTDSPVLSALDRIPIHQSVPYHSIIPLVGADAGTNDTVVAYSSSHVPGSESEMILDGTHFSQQKPVVTAELKRILQEHVQVK